ncbi:MAG: SDR family oxidoreductase [Blastocatellia bacterium]|nr:SDR family oxidoreductase [Blastocatellia bacterium]
MSKNFENKVVLVTGGSAGIGRATALAFAQEGAVVAVADLNEYGGAETVHLIKEAGGKAAFYLADVAKAADVQNLVQHIVSEFGRLDCAHNNAGISGDLASLLTCTEDNWNRIMDVNVRGVWNCMRAEIPQMIAQGGGSIVNTASIAGLVGTGLGMSTYAASKHAVMGLTKCAAMEHAKDKIRINAVCPGFTSTDMLHQFTEVIPDLEERILKGQPMGRIGQPEEVAQAVLWLCSAHASFVTGTHLVVDGGAIAR